MGETPTALKLDWPRPENDPHRLQEAVVRRTSTGASSTRVLVGMLFSGENQVREAVAALYAQVGLDIDLFLLSGLPNQEAHRALYEGFMGRAGGYDFFVKIDADMVLTSPTSLLDACRHAEAHHADHAVFSVHDWMSQTDIYGIHLYRSHLRWVVPPDERLFVDASPVHARAKRVVSEHPSPLAEHNPEPSDALAYAFGVHRGRKASQRRQPLSRYLCSQARDQYALLRTIHGAARERPERQRWLALAGAMRAIEDCEEAPDGDYRSHADAGASNVLEALPGDRLRVRVDAYWSDRRIRWRFELRRRVRCALATAARRVRRLTSVARR